MTDRGNEFVFHALNFLARRDVGIGTDQAQCITLGIALGDLGPTEYPAPFAVQITYAVLHFVEQGAPLERIVQILLQPRHVITMHNGIQRLDRGNGFDLVTTHDQIPLLAQAHFAGTDVPVKQCQIGTFKRQTQAFAALHQHFGVLSALGHILSHTDVSRKPVVLADDRRHETDPEFGATGMTHPIGCSDFR